MFLLKIMRFFTGFVRFRAFGGFGERFINLCSQSGIILWDVEADGENIIASASIDGYRNIRSCARKSGMKVRIIKKHGLPFFIFKNRKRTGIPVGIFIFTVSIVLLSTRIWVIDVEGNKSIPEETVIAAVEASGLHIGSSAIKTDPFKISLSAGGKIEGVSELAVNLHSSRAVIKIKEREKEPEIVDSSGMYDLVSSKDAQLVILEPYCGTVAAKRFNPVMKGEVLISGIVENRDLSAGYVHARGYAVGRTESVISADVERNENFKKFNSGEKNFSLYFLDLEIPHSKNEQQADFIFRKEKYLSYSGKRMPLGAIITKSTFVSGSGSQPTDKEKELICIERFMDSAKEYSKSRQIINETDTESFSSDTKTVSGRFTCYENIGVEREFSINELGGSNE